MGRFCGDPVTRPPIVPVSVSRKASAPPRVSAAPVMRAATSSSARGVHVPQGDANSDQQPVSPRHASS
jgi:hypothetical protein